ncbi:protein shisa-5-like [Saccostrea echinata]|uniref:protein shisa-5-like n=1 Tax=Saccostrea echinata TaxID=191078 RepID=UPI002A7FA79A|nr:protein shisa-5-like [Saccostrea echinata]
MASILFTLENVCFLLTCLLPNLISAAYYCRYNSYYSRYYCYYYYYYYYDYDYTYDSSGGAIAGAVIGGIVGLVIIATIITCVVVHCCKKKTHGQVIVHPTGYSASYTNTYHNAYGGYGSGPYVTTATINYAAHPSAPPPPLPAYPPPPQYQPPPAFHPSEPHTSTQDGNSKM